MDMAHPSPLGNPHPSNILALPLNCLYILITPAVIINVCELEMIDALREMHV